MESALSDSTISSFFFCAHTPWYIERFLSMWKAPSVKFKTVAAIAIAVTKSRKVSCCWLLAILVMTQPSFAANSRSSCWDSSDPDYQSTAGMGQGSEIVDLSGVGADYKGYLKVYVGTEPNPIPPEELSSYDVPGWIPNSPRHVIFDYYKTIGSPSAPAGALTPYTDPYDYTWGFIAQVQNYMWPFDPADYPQLSPPPSSGWEAAALAGSAVPKGVVMYTSNNKNQITIFTARNPETKLPVLRYFVTDPWGNKFIMKSSNNAYTTPESITAAFNASVLPKGWRKSMGYLPKDLCISPIYGGDYISAYQEIRDSADSAYSQFVWGEKGWGVAQKIGYPMPMWTSARGSLLRGTPGMDLMYGGPGNDVFVPSSGDDIVDGGAGFNVVVLKGSKRNYTVTVADGVATVVGYGSTKTLKRIQRLRFRNH